MIFRREKKNERTSIHRCNCLAPEGVHTEVCAFRLSMEAICEDCWGYQNCCWRERWRRLGFWGRIFDAFKKRPV